MVKDNGRPWLESQKLPEGVNPRDIFMGHIIEVDLSKARNMEQINFFGNGDLLAVEKLDGECDVVFNKKNSPRISLNLHPKINTLFRDLYLINEAQEGKTLKLFIGGDVETGGIDVDVTQGVQILETVSLKASDIDIVDGRQIVNIGNAGDIDIGNVVNEDSSGNEIFTLDNPGKVEQVGSNVEEIIYDESLDVVLADGESYVLFETSTEDEKLQVCEYDGVFRFGGGTSGAEFEVAVESTATGLGTRYYSKTVTGVIHGSFNLQSGGNRYQLTITNNSGESRTLARIHVTRRFL